MTAVLVIAAAGTSLACIGSECMQIWSTADGGGALTVQWDFADGEVKTFKSFCTTDDTACLYSTIDIGFIAPTTDDVPDDGYFPLLDGTDVRVEVVSADSVLTLSVNGQKLSQPGQSARLGIMPTNHVHPSWQVLVPNGVFGEYSLSYKLTTDAAAYTDSEVYSVVVTNVPPPVQTPTVTPTAAPAPACPGDCDGGTTTTVDEVLTCVNTALGESSVDICPACDGNGDGAVTVDEILSALNTALIGCRTALPATLDEIQRTIFTPRCAIPTCHDSQSHTGNLMLTADQAFDQLVGVPPDTPLARNHGFVRVDPGNPDNSFLLVKLNGPPPGEGNRMPLTGALLTTDQIDLIRNWILLGANP